MIRKTFISCKYRDVVERKSGNIDIASENTFFKNINRYIEKAYEKARLMDYSVCKRGEILQ